MSDDFCAYCHGARLVGWSGAGPLLCPECCHGKDAFTVITGAWREQRTIAQSLAAENEKLRRSADIAARFVRATLLHDSLSMQDFLDLRRALIAAGTMQGDE